MVSISEYLSIGGIVLTIMGIYYAFKFRNLPRITFIREDIIPLFRSIVQNVDGITINHNGQPISPNLFLLKSSVVNNGNVDIDVRIIHEPLRICLPSNYRAIQIKITNSSDNVKVIPGILNDQTIECKWELLKKNEYFSFDALIEQQEDQKNSNKITEEELLMRFDKNIKFKYRITNLDKVQKNNLLNYKKSKEMRGLLLLALINFFFSVGALYINHFNSQKTCYYTVKTGKGTENQITIDSRSKDKLKVKSIDKKIVERLTVDEFINKYKIPIVYHDDKFESVFTYISTVFITVLTILNLAFYYYVHRRDKKIRLLLGNDNRIH